jgi:DNA-binding CsgD family transcriptional regulator
VLIRSGRVPEAKEYLDIAERAAAEHRLEQAKYRTEAQQCHVLILQGSWDDAERRLRDLVESATDAGVNATNPLAFLGRILARRGDPAAGDLIQRAWDLAVTCGQEQKTAAAAGARIEWLWLNGDLAGARAVGAELLAIAVRMHHGYLRGEVLRYLRRAGVPIEPFPGCLPAYAAGIGGDWAAAAELWERAGNPYEQALELSESPDVAVVVRALGILDRLGATATSAIVRRQLRSDGVRSIPRGPRSATRQNPGRLTDRQLEILALLDQGCTNSEIADRLFLSRRTVDNHVSALLHRLGVGSRTAARAAATSAGLLRRET